MSGESLPTNITNEIPHVLSRQGRDLYAGLFGSPPSTPDKDYPRYCKAWAEYSQASSVWLWLCHDDHGTQKEWHLVGFHNSDKSLEEPKPMIRGGIDEKTKMEKLGVFDYCQKTGDIEPVEDPRTWAKFDQGKNYNILSREELIKWCRSFVVVPLPRVDRSEEEEEEEGRSSVGVHGAVCLHFSESLPPHYSTAHKKWPELVETHHWMGRFTAMAVYATHQAMQREILLELNVLAGKFLTRSSREAKQARRDYLQHLANLVQKRLNVTGVSVFYRNPHRHNEVSCLYSTGLYRSAEDNSPLGSLVPEDEWPQVSYDLKTGATGHCFATGLPTNMPVGLRHDPQTWESDTPNKDRGAPAIIYPIPLPPSEPSPKEGAEGRALGVIRCTEHKSKRFKDKRAFDPYEIETLDFIAQQVGPVLETMSRYAELELNIAVTRHELRSTIGLIHQLAEDMSEDLDPRVKKETHVRSYDVIDIKLSSMLARSQVQRLFTDGWETRPLQIVPVRLRGHIVARIASVMSRYAEQEREMRVFFDNASFDEIPQLMLDRYLIEQALINLIMNAVKYGKRGSSIKVSAGTEGMHFLLTVSNDGPGVTEAERDKIFTAGYRSPITQEQAEGSGLGLSITRIIMERHEGDVRLLNLCNPTTFALEFPRSRSRSAPGMNEGHL